MAARDPDLERFAEIPDPVRVEPRAVRAFALPAEPSSTRVERLRRSLLAGALAVGWVVLLVARLGTRDDLGAAPVALLLAAWGLVGVCGVALGLRSAARGLPRDVRAIRILVAGVPLVFLATVFLSTTGAPAAASVPWEANGRCLGAALAMAAGPVALAALALRRSFLSAPAWRGAAVGALCGLGGTLGVHAHCAAGALGHILFAHGAPIVAGALAGAGLGALRGRL